MKTKLKSHGNEVTDFYDKEIKTVDSHYNCLAVISLDSALDKDGNYYPQAFLSECKYIKKKDYTDYLESSSADSDDSDEE